MLPVLYSRILNRPRDSDDLPAPKYIFNNDFNIINNQKNQSIYVPVRPTMPIFSPGAISAQMLFKTLSNSSRYLTE